MQLIILPVALPLDFLNSLPNKRQLTCPRSHKHHRVLLNNLFNLHPTSKDMLMSVGECMLPMATIRLLRWPDINQSIQGKPTIQINRL